LSNTPLRPDPFVFAKRELGLRAKYRKIDQAGMSYQLCEKQNSYNSNFAPENMVLSAENMYFGMVLSIIQTVR